MADRVDWEAQAIPDAVGSTLIFVRRRLSLPRAWRNLSRSTRRTVRWFHRGSGSHAYRFAGRVSFYWRPARHRV